MERYLFWLDTSRASFLVRSFKPRFVEVAPRLYHVTPHSPLFLITLVAHQVEASKSLAFMRLVEQWPDPFRSSAGAEPLAAFDGRSPHLRLQATDNIPHAACSDPTPTEATGHASPLDQLNADNDVHDVDLFEHPDSTSLPVVISAVAIRESPGVATAGQSHLTVLLPCASTHLPEQSGHATIITSNFRHSFTYVVYIDK